MTVYPNQPSWPGPPTGPYRPPRPPRHGLSFGVVAAIVLVVAVVIGLVASRSQSHGYLPGRPLGQDRGSSAQPVDSQAPPADLSAAAKAVVPGIVTIDTQLGLQNGEAAGTGIVLTSGGVVLTNNHVVEGSTKISVTDLGNGKTYPAAVLGFDRQDDLAVIQLSGASGLQIAPLGDSGKVAVGDNIVGVGNAGGTGSPTAAAGRVTGLNRSITASDDASGSSEQLTGLIQVAADIQPGDSGGPLVDQSGKVIGVDTAATQGFRFGAGGGQGFAIPINKALTIAQQIRSGTASGNVHIGDTAFLGVTVSDSNGQGAQVRNIVSDGPADQLGLQPGDLITGVDGRTVDSATGLTGTMDLHHPKDSVTLTWVDQSGQSRSAKVTLGKGPVG